MYHFFRCDFKIVFLKYAKNKNKKKFHASFKIYGGLAPMKGKFFNELHDEKQSTKNKTPNIKSAHKLKLIKLFIFFFFFLAKKSYEYDVIKQTRAYVVHYSEGKLQIFM